VGSVPRKTYTKPLPDAPSRLSAKAKRSHGGKTDAARRERHPRQPARIVATSRKWLAKYRNGDGLVVEVSTGCTDKAAAEQRLRELERQADSGVVTSAEDKAVVHHATDGVNSCQELIYI